MAPEDLSLYKFRITIKNGISLRNISSFGKLDPYVRVQYNSNSYYTKPDRNGGPNPSWNVSFNFSGTSPLVDFAVYDKHLLRDRIIGKSRIALDRAPLGISSHTLVIYEENSNIAAGNLCVSVEINQHGCFPSQNQNIISDVHPPFGYAVALPVNHSCGPYGSMVRHDHQVFNEFDRSRCIPVYTGGAGGGAFTSSHYGAIRGLGLNPINGTPPPPIQPYFPSYQMGTVYGPNTQSYVHHSTLKPAVDCALIRRNILCPMYAGSQSPDNNSGKDNSDNCDYSCSWTRVTCSGNN